MPCRARAPRPRPDAEKIRAAPAITAGAKLAGAEDREDVAQLAVGVADCGVQHDVGLGGAERAAADLARSRA
jgi:hypothetical protein